MAMAFYLCYAVLWAVAFHRRSKGLSKTCQGLGSAVALRCADPTAPHPSDILRPHHTGFVVGLRVTVMVQEKPLAVASVKIHLLVSLWFVADSAAYQ